MSGNGFVPAHDCNVIPTIPRNLQARTRGAGGPSKTMNAEGWYEKAGDSGARYWLSGQTGQQPRSVEYVPGEITSADTNGRPFVRCQPPSPTPSTSPPFTDVANRSLVAVWPRNGTRSPFLSSVQFKENACRRHVLIHSYGFASRQ